MFAPKTLVETPNGEGSENTSAPTIGPTTIAVSVGKLTCLTSATPVSTESVTLATAV